MSSLALLEWLRPRRAAMLEVLRAYVERESPSREKAALDILAGDITQRRSALGGVVQRIGNPQGGDFVRARFDLGGPAEAPAALVLGHFDTVWPLGTLARRPFRIAGDRAYGPGTFDMKASLVLLEFAIDAIRACGLTPPRPIVARVHLRRGNRQPDLAARHRGRGAPGRVRPGARMPPARRGFSRRPARASARSPSRCAAGPAHAGVEPEKGASAIIELAHQVLRIAALADPGAGTTLNVGTVAGGTASNVVAAEASARVDVRTATRAEAQRIEQALRTLPPVTPGTTIHVEGGMNRPPMERTPALAAFFGRARTIANSLGILLTEGATGGGSDGNITAALGTLTLDGLGTLGGGAHADDEHILLDPFPDRAALLAALLLNL